MEYVILVNRTSKPLTATWNGRQFKLMPGDNPLPLATAEAAKRQNPVMGTQGADPWDTEFLCGIRELGDPIEPIEQSNKKELIRAEELHPGKEMVEIPGVASIYRRVNQIQDGALPASASFGANDVSRELP